MERDYNLFLFLFFAQLLLLAVVVLIYVNTVEKKFLFESPFFLQSRGVFMACVEKKEDSLVALFLNTYYIHTRKTHTQSGRSASVYVCQKGPREKRGTEWREKVL